MVKCQMKDVEKGDEVKASGFSPNRHYNLISFFQKVSSPFFLSDCGGQLLIGCAAQFALFTAKQLSIR